MSKYKVKFSKAVVKRFKATATGKYIRHKAGRSHLLQKKTSSRKHYLRKAVSVKRVDYALLKGKILSK